MIEALTTGLLGSLFGGLFRLAPELIKFLDRKGDRAHELAMFDRQCDLEKTRGQLKLDEIGAQRDLSIDTGVMAAFKSAIDQQTELTKVAGGWVAKISAAVRPVLTFWIWTLYTMAFISSLYLTWQATGDLKDMIAVTLTPDFLGLLGGITNYWFLDRTLNKRGL